MHSYLETIVRKKQNGGCKVWQTGGEVAWMFKEGVMKLPVDRGIMLEFEGGGPREGASTTFSLRPACAV